LDQSISGHLCVALATVLVLSPVVVAVDMLVTEI
jgi:hypothetical protein